MGGGASVVPPHVSPHVSPRASHLLPSPFGVYYTYHQVRPLPISSRVTLAALSIRCVLYLSPGTSAPYQRASRTCCPLHSVCILSPGTCAPSSWPATAPSSRNRAGPSRVPTMATAGPSRRPSPRWAQAQAQAQAQARSSRRRRRRHRRRRRRRRGRCQARRRSRCTYPWKPRWPSITSNQCTM